MSSPPINAIRAAARLFVQVSIQTRKRPLGFYAYHYGTNFAALVVRGCDQARHIGDLKPRG
jgi:hypothetical protein